MGYKQEGWYLVMTRRAHLGKWEAALLDENKYWYLAGCDEPLPYTWPLEIGPRIPMPDEPWQTVPMTWPESMASGLCSKISVEEAMNFWSHWPEVLAAAPKP